VTRPNWYFSQVCSTLTLKRCICSCSCIWTQMAGRKAERQNGWADWLPGCMDGRPSLPRLWVKAKVAHFGWNFVELSRLLWQCRCRPASASASVSVSVVVVVVISCFSPCCRMAYTHIYTPHTAQADPNKHFRPSDNSRASSSELVRHFYCRTLPAPLYCPSLSHSHIPSLSL